MMNAYIIPVELQGTVLVGSVAHGLPREENVPVGTDGSLRVAAETADKAAMVASDYISRNYEKYGIPTLEKVDLGSAVLDERDIDAEHEGVLDDDIFQVI